MAAVASLSARKPSAGDGQDANDAPHTWAWTAAVLALWLATLALAFALVIIVLRRCAVSKWLGSKGGPGRDDVVKLRGGRFSDGALALLPGALLDLLERLLRRLLAPLHVGHSVLERRLCVRSRRRLTLPERGRASRRARG